MTYPIPDDALDDRLAVTGTSGAGKTYAVLGAAARLMKRGSRFIGIDALGVMWGLRLTPDGSSPSSFKPVIFGGEHGDLPITPGAGALIGETAATMAESMILDLSGLGSKAAERRFMLAFLTALEKHANKEPVHLLIDEADLWAPQKIFDKEGETMKLLGRMDNIVRRGRIKGFIPWLITQRPAVLSKDVLSQADGVIAMKLTSSQDREAIGGWIEGQADRAKGREILALLPTLDRGEAVVWLPGHGLLKTSKFPENKTFDSSKTPERGKMAAKVHMTPLDLDKLKTRLARVQEEAQGNDPAILRAQVAKLEAMLRTKIAAKTPPATVTPKDDKAALRDREAAFAAGAAEGAKTILDMLPAALDAQHEASLGQGYDLAHDDLRAALGKGKTLPPDRLPVRKPLPKDVMPAWKGRGTKAVVNVPGSRRIEAVADLVEAVLSGGRQQDDGYTHSAAIHVAPGEKLKHTPPAVTLHGNDIPMPQRRVLDAIGFWMSVGHDTPSREQIAGVAGYSATSGNFRNIISNLRTAGLVRPFGDNHLMLDIAAEYRRLTAGEAHARLTSVLSTPEKKLIEVLVDHDTISREDLGAASGYSASSGNFRNLISHLSTLNIIIKPDSATVALTDWARKVLVG